MAVAGSFGIPMALASLGSSLFGGSGSSSKRWTNHWNQVQMNWARDQATKSIQWRVADAKKAGVHPLFALGANTPMSSPSFMVGSDGGSDGYSLGNSLASLGQELTRSVNSTASDEDRFSQKMSALSLERGELENTLLRSQIAKMNASLPPAMPSFSPMSESEFYRMPGAALPSTQKFSQADGSVVEWPSNAAKQAVEDSMYEWEHMYRNRVLPAASDLFYDYVYAPYQRVRDRVISNSRRYTGRR